MYVAADDGSYLQQYYATANEQTPEERGATLEQSDGITTAHEASCQEGQTEVRTMMALACRCCVTYETRRLLWTRPWTCISFVLLSRMVTSTS
jgi:hypothetical protein